MTRLASPVPPLCRTVALVAALTAPAGAQSFNIDFGAPTDVPSPTYAGAGGAGVWNAIGALASGVRMGLVDTGGAVGAVDIRQIGGVEMLLSDDPATDGDDEALLDDMFVSYNDPLDACIWIDNLENGTYRVITYALTPNDPTLESRVRVDFADQGPVQVGGAWGGGHVEGISYAVHTLAVTSGEIGLHSGLPGALVQSGINAIQIAKVPTTDTGEVITPPPIRGAFPNPFRTEVVLIVDPAGSDGIEVLDVAGRLVRVLELPSRRAVRVVRWDGRDRTGRAVAPGVYFVRIPGEGTMARTLTVVRHD